MILSGKNQVVRCTHLPDDVRENDVNISTSAVNVNIHYSNSQIPRYYAENVLVMYIGLGGSRRYPF